MKRLKLLKQMAVILSICFAGEFVRSALHLIVPGNVIGMLLMLFCLKTGIVKIHNIEEISNFLLDHLAFFFLPAGVGLISCFTLVKGSLFSLITITFISTIIIMATTGIVVQATKRR